MSKMNYNRPSRPARSTYVDYRNYDAEATELLKEVKGNQIYTLYEIVTNQLKRSSSDTKRKELEAVKKAIETSKNVDEGRLAHIVRGYSTSMAADANARDGNTTVQRKKG